MGNLLTTECLSISNSASRKDNSSLLMSCKFLPYHRFSFLPRGKEKLEGSPPTVTRLTGTVQQPGRQRLRREHARLLPTFEPEDASSGRDRRSDTLDRSGLLAAGGRSPEPRRRRQQAAKTAGCGAPHTPARSLSFLPLRQLAFHATGKLNSSA